MKSVSIWHNDRIKRGINKIYKAVLGKSICIENIVVWLIVSRVSTGVSGNLFSKITKMG